MFKIRFDEDGMVALSGRLDASQADAAAERLRDVTKSVTLDCSDLEYISSAGLSVIIETYKRLNETGHRIKLIRMSRNVRNVFRYAGLDRILEIE